MIADPGTGKAESSGTQPQGPPAADQNTMNAEVSEIGTIPATGAATVSAQHRMRKAESNATEPQRTPTADLMHLGAARRPKWTLRGQYLATHR